MQNMDEVFFKVARLEKAVDEAGKPVIQGIVSSTKVDYDNERMSKKALYGLQKDLLSNTSVFFNHRYDGLAVGKTANAWVQEDGEDAYLWAAFSPTDAKGPIDSSGVLVESVVQQLNEGTLKCLSVGGKKIKEFADTATKGVNVLDEVKGLEYSLVGIGANPDAMLKSFAKSAYVKSVEERVAKSHARSPAEMEMALDASPKPVLAPVKKPAKDGQVVEATRLKTEYEAAYVKGGEMTTDVVKGKCAKCGHEYEVEKKVEPELQKENQAMTPNKPALLSEEQIEDIVSRLLARVKAPAGPVSGDSHAKSGEAEMPPSAEKSVKTIEEKMDKFIERMEKNFSSPKGLTVQEEKFDAVKQVPSANVGGTASEQFSKMIAV